MLGVFGSLLSQNAAMNPSLPTILLLSSLALDVAPSLVTTALDVISFTKKQDQKCYSFVGTDPVGKMDVNLNIGSDPKTNHVFGQPMQPKLSLKCSHSTIKGCS